MLKVTYNLAVGNWSVNSADDPRTEFITLETVHSVDSPADHCHIAVYAPSAPQPGLLGESIGEVTSAIGFDGEKEEAFSMQLRGNAIKQGDQITLELAVGDRSAQVTSGYIQSFESSFGITTLVGATGKQKLALTRINQVYQSQTLRQIAVDLAHQSGVDVGDVETGQTYPYFVVHESKTVLKHIQELAMREGMDLYFDTDNKLTMKAFNKTSADHTFHYGINILDLYMDRHQPMSGHLLIYGESPSSNQGSDTWHWLVKDLKPFRSEVGKGSERLGITDGAVRTKDAADSLAKSKLGAMKDQATAGRLKILGNPTVQLGDAIEIMGVPKPELNGLFKVVSVRHRYSKQRGFVTTVGFTGHGGATKAGGLLGQAVGQLTGAVGL